MSQRVSTVSAGGRWRRPSPRLIVLVAVAGLVSTALLAPLAAARTTPPRGQASEPRPSALWKAFPLHVSQPAAALVPETREPDVPVSAVVPTALVRSEGSSRNPLAVAAGIAIVMLAAGGAALLLLRGPTRRWRRALTGAVSHNSVAGRTYTLMTSAFRASDQSYVLVVPGRKGWGDRVVEREGEPPAPGEVIIDDELGREGQAYIVKDVGRSPLPGDQRPCAILRTL